MIISEHIVNEENGTECYKIFFEIYDKKDITIEKYKKIKNEIEMILYNENEKL